MLQPDFLFLLNTLSFLFTFVFPTVVLHAVRLASEDREKILGQVALACLHFQLLTHKQ